jgi:hypothetical protein
LWPISREDSVNEQALVYSGLLAGIAALASENAPFTAAYNASFTPSASFAVNGLAKLLELTYASAGDQRPLPWPRGLLHRV